MGLQTIKIVRKRRLDSQKAKRQQQGRRRKILFKKAYEYSLECDADVYISIRIKKNGRVFTFNSDSGRDWPLRTLRIEQDNYYPLPVRTTPEDFNVTGCSTMALKRDQGTCMLMLGHRLGAHTNGSMSMETTGLGTADGHNVPHVRRDGQDQKHERV
jgi:hypothetical protein